MTLRTVFFGSNDFVLPIVASLYSLRALETKMPDIHVDTVFPHHQTLDKIHIAVYEAGMMGATLELVGVVTQPDKVHRGNVISNPVAQWARDNHVTLFQPSKLNQSVEEFVRIFGKIDLGVVASYGQIISQNILNISRFGCINWHPSLLPKYRGPTPLQQSLADGCSSIGITWITMTPGMDAGPMLMQLARPRSDKDIFSEVIGEFGRIGAQTVHTAASIQIASIHDPTFCRMQDETQATFTKMIRKEDKYIDPSNLHAQDVKNRIAGYGTFPGVVFKSPFFDSEVRLDSAGKVQDTLIDVTILFEDEDWVQCEAPEGRIVLLKCMNNSLLRIDQITLLPSGKRIKFSGFDFRA